MRDIQAWLGKYRTNRRALGGHDAGGGGRQHFNGTGRDLRPPSDALARFAEGLETFPSGINWCSPQEVTPQRNDGAGSDTAVVISNRSAVAFCSVPPSTTKRDRAVILRLRC